MKYIKKYCVPFLIIFSILLVLTIGIKNNLTKTTGGGREVEVKPFSSFNILFADRKYPIEKVCELFNTFSYKGVITARESPLVFSYASEASLALCKTSLFINDYINRRKAFFLDKSGAYNLYYVPKRYNLLAVKDALTARGVSCGINLINTLSVTDTFSKRVRFLPFILTLFFSLLTFLLSAKKYRPLCPLIFIFPFAFSLVGRTPALALSCILIVYVSYLMLKIQYKVIEASHKDARKRRYITVEAAAVFNCLKTSYFLKMIVFLIVCVLNCLFIRASLFLCCLLVITGQAVLFIIVKNIITYLNSKRSFKVFPILQSIKTKSVNESYRILYLMLFTFLIFLLTSFDIYTARLNSGKRAFTQKTQGVELPLCIKGKGEGSSFPNYSDYLNFSYELLTLPYRSIYDGEYNYLESEEENKERQVKYYTYSEEKTAGGGSRIVESEEVYKFNDEFKLFIDSLFNAKGEEERSFIPIEKLLKEDEGSEVVWSGEVVKEEKVTQNSLDLPNTYYIAYLVFLSLFFIFLLFAYLVVYFPYLRQRKSAKDASRILGIGKININATGQAAIVNI